MLFILLTFFSALFLESIGTIVSIQGLTLLFGVEPLIIALAIAFDFGKLIAVSVLYKEWKELPRQLKYYMTAASIVLMTITSAGGAGYLSAASQKALLPTKSLQVKVEALTQEKQKLELRKKEIDNQITNLPADFVKGRTKLIANFKEELEHLNSRIVQLDQELPQAQVELIDKSSHAGPITYIAEATHSTAEQAMGVIIGLIIFVFDPLAIALILAGNYLVEKRQERLRQIHPTSVSIIEPEEVDILEPREVIFEKPASEPTIEEIKEQLKEEIKDEIEEEIENDLTQLSAESEANNLDAEEADLYPLYAREQVELAKQVVAEATKPEQPIVKSSLEDIEAPVGSEVTFGNSELPRSLGNIYR